MELSINDQTFARKLIRPFAGRTTEEEIKNEVRAVEKLCNGSHPNIVKVFRHGRLRTEHSVYFIDMEWCDMNLDEFIKGVRPVTGLLDWPKAGNQNQIRYTISEIIKQILSGLIFIHGHDEVHRDISPQNRI